MMAEYWGSGNLGGGGGGANKSMIFVTAPEGTESVTASYHGKAIRGNFKDGRWVISGLAYGEGVVWEVTAKRKSEKATQTVPMPILEIKYIELSYWDGSIYSSGDQCVGITGGWINGGTITSPGWDGQELIFGAHSMSIETQSGYGAAYLTTKKPLDLTKYAYIEFNISECNALNCRVDLVITNSNDVSWFCGKNGQTPMPSIASLNIEKPGIYKLKIPSKNLTSAYVGIVATQIPSYDIARVSVSSIKVVRA